ncbi:MAG: EamA family transporter [Bryobacteraceae bacterium]|jgi:drug/metabolite transporter (DMT)-like permease
MSGTHGAQGPQLSLHTLGVVCGLAAGAWLGAAEAPTKLVTTGISPFVISLGMVAGVFVARWTLPVAIKGTSYVWLDLRGKPHLVVWALLAGMLWAVANTLTVFAIRNVGLSVAFPLWNTNSLVGLFWGWLLFNELRDAGRGQWAKVLGGASGIVAGAMLLAWATSYQPPRPEHSAAMGVAAALMAGVLWGTMYIPYRKAYISGMNPLSFVTVFTFGELATCVVLAASFHGGWQPMLAELGRVRPAMFWLFLGGFCWVIGDLFQQYAAKYIGIGRGIPLSNTNQLWGLAWGALVFGEFAGLGGAARSLIISGSLVMIAGAAAISIAAAPEAERRSWRKAVQRECQRYGLRESEVEDALAGVDTLSASAPARRWWEFVVVALAVGVFVWLGWHAERQPLEVDLFWLWLLTAASLAVLLAGGWLLWKRTRFS